MAIKGTQVTQEELDEMLVQTLFDCEELLKWKGKVLKRDGKAL